MAKKDKAKKKGGLDFETKRSEGNEEEGAARKRMFLGAVDRAREELFSLGDRKNFLSALPPPFHSYFHFLLILLPHVHIALLFSLLFFVV